jgi:hypothetical protein
MFPRLIAVGKFDAYCNGRMRRLGDEEESIPIGREAGLSIFGENHRRSVILMRQFKAEAVGFELDMAGEQIEKRQNGKPDATHQSRTPPVIISPTASQ